MGTLFLDTRLLTLTQYITPICTFTPHRCPAENRTLTYILKLVALLVFAYLFHCNYNLTIELHAFHIHVSMSHVAAMQILGHCHLYYEICSHICFPFVTSVSVTLGMFVLETSNVVHMGICLSVM